jgi:hypothetical protein
LSSSGRGFRSHEGRSSACLRSPPLAGLNCSEEEPNAETQDDEVEQHLDGDDQAGGLAGAVMSPKPTVTGCGTDAGGDPTSPGDQPLRDYPERDGSAIDPCEHLRVALEFGILVQANHGRRSRLRRRRLPQSACS